MIVKVAPLAGARIEIILIVMFGYLVLSLPSRERGLKLITPSAWCPALICRSPRGSAD